MENPRIQINQLNSIAGMSAASDIFVIEREISGGVFEAFKVRKDKLGVHNAEIIGGYRQVSNTYQRDNIDNSFRVLGLACYVSDQNKLYRLQGGTSNANWVEVKDAVTSANELAGGYHIVATITDRNAIESGLRAEGMLCHVVSEGKTYILSGGVDNSNWAEVQYGKEAANELIGGYHTAADLTARDAISASLRVVGMTCYVLSNKKTYILDGGVDNSNWVEVVFSGSTTAEDVSYVNAAYPLLTDVKLALDFLLYVNTEILSFSSSVTQVLIGTTISSTNLTWSTNKDVTSVSINQGIGSIDPSLTAYTDTASYSTDRTYTITVSDGTTSDSASASVSFRYQRFWGVSSETTLDSAGISALNNELATSRSQTRSITAASQYVYFVWPTTFGVATFTVNGLPNTAWTATTQSYTNSAGNTSNYYVYRSDNLLTGTYSIVVS